ncbi:MAG: dTDP-4-dehydrorhamnose reductase [Parcubacteria group bacterium]|nr:dTDP-4-dehydrorhamnose reductase [Parcubacteria group bacterium]
MKKILIIGGKGMLGQDLVDIFSNDNNYEVTNWDKDEIDITKEDQVVEKISKLKPEIVINSAAYTDVDGCEDNRELCMSVNGDALKNLAKACKEIDSILVHFSTDYIFNGEREEGYEEDFNEINPVNYYGEAKAQAEKNIKDNCDKYYILRTSWLFGKNGKNFVDTMLSLAEKLDELKVIDDQHGKPTYTLDLVKRTKKIIENKEEFGIYHVTNEEETTWYQFALEIFKQAGVKIKVNACTSEEFPTKAKRPHYSGLINTKLNKMRSWKEALEDYLK